MKAELSKLELQDGDVLVVSIPWAMACESTKIRTAINKGLEGFKLKAVIVLGKGETIDAYTVSETGQLCPRPRLQVPVTIRGERQGICGLLSKIWRAMAGGSNRSK